MARKKKWFCVPAGPRQKFGACYETYEEAREDILAQYMDFLEESENAVKNKKERKKIEEENNRKYDAAVGGFDFYDGIPDFLMMEIEEE